MYVSEKCPQFSLKLRKTTLSFRLMAIPVSLHASGLSNGFVRHKAKTCENVFKTY